MRYFTARDFPELRAKLVAYYPDGLPVNPSQSRETREAVRRTLREAELFYITSDMCQLATRAGRSLEVFDLQPFDVIAPHALLYFEDRISGLGNMLSISVSENYMTVRLFVSAAEAHSLAGGLKCMADSGEVPSLFAGREYLDEILDAHLSELPPVVGVTGAALPFGKRFDDVPILRADFVPTLMSTLLLMKQPISSTSVVSADRPAQRRIKRAGLPVTSVRVITLRSVSTQGEGEGREWLHRWVVRGHWRMQPCGPGGELRRPTWIEPHLKGPEDAPLLGGEKVYAWRR